MAGLWNSGLWEKLRYQSVASPSSRTSASRLASLKPESGQNGEERRLCIHTFRDRTVGDWET
ncbi:MAG: hypothetical protein KDC10_02505 [Calditrichaeota bacterium]|nr:hypothetical protein [Calditrichota bacterium]